MKNVTDVLRKQNILVLILQETRYRYTDTFETGNYRKKFKGKARKNIMKIMLELRIVFCMNKKILGNQFLLAFRQVFSTTLKCTNKLYVKSHTPINKDKKIQRKQKSSGTC